MSVQTGSNETSGQIRKRAERWSKDRLYAEAEGKKGGRGRGVIELRNGVARLKGVASSALHDNILFFFVASVPIYYRRSCPA